MVLRQEVLWISESECLFHDTSASTITHNFLKYHNSIPDSTGRLQALPVTVLSDLLVSKPEPRSKVILWAPDWFTVEYHADTKTYIHTNAVIDLAMHSMFRSGLISSLKAQAAEWAHMPSPSTKACHYAKTLLGLSQWMLNTPMHSHALIGMVWYSSLTSHSTQYNSFLRRGPWAVTCTSHSVMEGQRHNNPLNPRCFCLQRPKRDEASS